MLPHRVSMNELKGSRHRTVSLNDACSLPIAWLSSTKPSVYAAETKMRSLRTDAGKQRRRREIQVSPPKSEDTMNCDAVRESEHESGDALRSASFPVAVHNALLANQAHIEHASIHVDADICKSRLCTGNVQSANHAPRAVDPTNSRGREFRELSLWS